jgi:hypothetical protein
MEYNMTQIDIDEGLRKELEELEPYWLRYKDFHGDIEDEFLSGLLVARGMYSLKRMAKLYILALDAQKALEYATGNRLKHPLHEDHEVVIAAINAERNSVAPLLTYHVERLAAENESLSGENDRLRLELGQLKNLQKG